MDSDDTTTKRARLLAGAKEVHAQANVIETCADQQEFEEALADIEAAIARLRRI